MFSFTLAEGNPEEALREPNNIVISRQMGCCYFSRLFNIDEIFMALFAFRSYHLNKANPRSIVLIFYNTRLQEIPLRGLQTIFKSPVRYCHTHV